MSGSGDTDFEALYDLLGGLYVIPISESIPLRAVTFLKMVLLEGVAVSKARQLFQRDRPNQREAQILALSKQALLSTAGLIKCAEAGVSDVSTDQKVMAVLYDDDYIIDGVLDEDLYQELCVTLLDCIHKFHI